MVMKTRDLSSDPSTCIKSHLWQYTSVTPVLRVGGEGMETGRQPELSVSTRFSETLLSQKQGGEQQERIL